MYGEQEYLGNTRKERNAVYKKSRLVANINKPLAINSNILMFMIEIWKTSTHLVIKVHISNTLVSCILVDNGSGFSILFKDVAENMGILDNINIENTTLHTFNRTLVQSLRTVKLVIQDEPHNHLVAFHVMDCPTLITPSSAETDYTR
ncbi:hypothetical protein DVH24_027525 [Malus domestica]|uniref:Uncharacterized protein n=1 Tax=Malus domestica TaxID=3750 RepID=A0A498H7K5_MALDO|nr:hypothetical protein DVH24_027525 [Malus domestica]